MMESKYDIMSESQLWEEHKKLEKEKNHVYDLIKQIKEKKKRYVCKYCGHVFNKYRIWENPFASYISSHTTYEYHYYCPKCDELLNTYEWEIRIR